MEALKMDPPHHLTVVLPFASADELVELYSGCITEGGIYLPVEPLPVRTVVQIEVKVSTGEVVLRAAGAVAFVTAPGKRGHPGMGLRFVHLDGPSRALVERACAGRVTDPQLPPLPDGIEMAAGEASPQTTPRPTTPTPTSIARPEPAAPRPGTPTPASIARPEPAPAMPPPQSRPSGFALRSATVPKAPVKLKVRVPAQAQLATRVESVALTFTARRPLPLWTVLDLELDVAGPHSGVWHARGEVISVEGDRLTVRLADAPPAAVKALRQAGSAGAPGARVDVWTALLLLSDEMLADVAAETLCSKGIAAFDGVAEGLVPDIVAADAGYLVAAARRFPHARVVAVNLSGPDALVGEASRLRPKAFLKKPTAAAALVNAIASLVHP